MRAPREIPPPLELECLKALWSLGEASVKDVQAALVRDRKLAYTTVMTILERLARKGGVMRRKSGRAYLYSPRLSREYLRQLAARELIDGFFDGSEEALIDFVQTGRARPAAMAAAAGAHPVDTSDRPPLDASLL